MHPHALLVARQGPQAISRLGQRGGDLGGRACTAKKGIAVLHRQRWTIEWCFFPSRSPLPSKVGSWPASFAFGALDGSAEHCLLCLWFALSPNQLGTMGYGELTTFSLSFLCFVASSNHLSTPVFE